MSFLWIQTLSSSSFCVKYEVGLQVKIFSVIRGYTNTNSSSRILCPYLPGQCTKRIFFCCLFFRSFVNNSDDQILVFYQLHFTIHLLGNLNRGTKKKKTLIFEENLAQCIKQLSLLQLQKSYLVTSCIGFETIYKNQEIYPLAIQFKF